MTRYTVTAPATVSASGYSQPERKLRKGDVVDLTAAEVTAIGGSNLRAVVTAVTGPAAVTGTRDQLGETYGVSNATP